MTKPPRYATNQSMSNPSNKQILREAYRLFTDEALGFLIPVIPGMLLFWLLPSWLLPILFAFGGFVWAMMWLGKRDHFDNSTGLQLIAYILFMVLMLVGIVPDLHDVIVLGESRVVSIQYEEDVVDQPPLKVLYFENWEVEMDYFTKYSRRVQSSSTNSSNYITSYMVPLRRKKQPKEEVYVVVVEGGLPLPAEAKDYWQRPGLKYGFIPNKLERLGVDRETLRRMEWKGAIVHPDAVFVELFDSPNGKRKQVLYYLGVKLGLGGLVWLMIHLGVLIHRLWKNKKG